MDEAGGRYLVAGTPIAPGDAGFHAWLALAHALRIRPLCLCVDPPLEVYLASFGAVVIAKRMPGSGHAHAVTCPHHQSEEDAERTAPLIGTAIQEDPDSGTTVLKLDFALGTRTTSTQPPSGETGEDVADPGRRLTLSALLRYLWSEAGLDQWRPEWAGRRHWGTVRRRLLGAAIGKVVAGKPLPSLLIVPEPFSIERRDEIAARYAERMRVLARPSGDRRALGLLLAEVKRFTPARLGQLATFKHWPDRPLRIDDTLMARLLRRHEDLLDRWTGDEALHLVMLATFLVRDGMLPTIRECTIALAEANWTLASAGSAGALGAGVDDEPAVPAECGPRHV